MTPQQETKTEKLLLYVVTCIMTLTIAIGGYTYSNDQKAQTKRWEIQEKVNDTQSAQILRLQEQMIEVLRDNSGNEQIFKNLEEKLDNTRKTMKEGFDKIDRKLDNIK